VRSTSADSVPASRMVTVDGQSLKVNLSLLSEFGAVIGEQQISTAATARRYLEALGLPGDAFGNLAGSAAATRAYSMRTDSEREELQAVSENLASLSKAATNGAARIARADSDSVPGFLGELARLRVTARKGGR
jgi:hypothetical protein